MTAQIGEILRYGGNTVRMCDTPLSGYFALGGRRPEPDFDSFRCTALWRGYVGTWEIFDDRLYLVGLAGELEDGSSGSLATVFPDFPDRVFAHWHSGTIRIPEGKLLQYVHMGFSSRYERDVFLEFRNGNLVSTETRTNGTASDDGGTTGYGIGAMTVFRRRSKKEAE